MNNVNDVLDLLIQKASEFVGKPVALMTKEDKVKGIEYLDRKSAFLIKKSGQKVCDYFGLSKYTLYSYLEIIRGADYNDKE